MSDVKILYIAQLIREGYQMGYDPYWNLEATNDVLSSDTDIEHIAELVEQGFTSGCEPTWKIEVSN